MIEHFDVEEFVALIKLRHHSHKWVCKLTSKENRGATQSAQVRARRGNRIVTKADPVLPRELADKMLFADDRYGQKTGKIFEFEVHMVWTLAECGRESGKEDRVADTGARRRPDECLIYPG